MCLQNLDRTALQPVNPDGSSVFERNSGVPVVFSACDASGKPIGTKDFVTSVTQPSRARHLPARRASTSRSTRRRRSFVYTKSTGTWTGYIQASKLTPGKQYVYRVLLADGTSFTLTFGIR